MSEHLPDVKLSAEQHERALAVWHNELASNQEVWRAAKLIVSLQARVAELEQCELPGRCGNGNCRRCYPTTGDGWDANGSPTK